MKTTVDLPDELMRAVKIRAATEGRKLKDLMADLVRRGLADPPDVPRTTRAVKLPLVLCKHPAPPEEEMTPDRVAAALIEEEAAAAKGQA